MEDPKQDLIETAESIYHKEVARIQMSTQRTEEDFLHTIHLEQDQYEDAHPDDAVEEIADAFATRVEEGLGKIGRKRDKSIAIQQEILQRTKDAIAWHYIAKEIGEHSVNE